MTTPLPQFEDRDLDVSSQVHNSRPSRNPPVSAPSPSPASVANPYLSVSPLPQVSFVRPSRFCSFSQPGSAARRPSSQAHTVPLRSRSLPPRHPLSHSRVGVLVLPLLIPPPGFSVLSPPAPITLSPLTGGPPSAPCAPTSMLTSRGSSSVTSRWTGFAGMALVPARCASEF